VAALQQLDAEVERVGDGRLVEAMREVWWCTGQRS